jgi:two-component system LytT family response regulator
MPASRNNHGLTLIPGGTGVATNSPKLLVPAAGKLILIDLLEIEWVEARGNYCVVHSNGQSYKMRTTLKDLVPRLSDTHFMRVHRSAVVNLSHIREISTWIRGRHEIALRSGDRIPLSRDRWKTLRDQLMNLAAPSVALSAVS